MRKMESYTYLLWVDYGQGEGWGWYGADTLEELLALANERSDYPQVVTRPVHLRVTVEEDA
jgi:hypothetical protein